MSSDSFCPICKEGLWLNLLARISFIDSLDQDCSKIHPKLKLNVVPLAQFRSHPVYQESYQLTWYNEKGDRVKKFDDQYSIKLDRKDQGRSWRVKIVFQSDEIRKPSELLQSFLDFKVCEHY